jgi:hypothetical protein
MARKRFPEDLKFAGEQIRYAFDSWNDDAPIETLEDLRDLLVEVRDEMEEFDGDDLIFEHLDELYLTRDYESLFTEPGDDNDPVTFHDRMANVEEDIEHLEELIEGLGESFKFTDLPKPKHMKKKPKAA